jgi:putative addiction module killer protein
MFKVKIYRANNGFEPFTEWLLSLKDKQSQLRIRHRIERLKLGNFGDTKSVGEGIYELRFFFGSGYRVYYARSDDTVILLLCGGDKSSQVKDIERAKQYWKELEK